MKKQSFFLLLGVALAISSCSGTTDEPNPEGPIVTPDEPSTITPATPIELTAGEAASRSACASCGRDFFATELAKHAENENIVLSPFSAATALAFYANAAGDELSQQIQKLLGSTDIDALNSYTAKMAAQLPTLDLQSDLAIANSVWYSRFYTLTPSFASVAEEIYNSPCKPVNFVDHAAVQALIDEWVKNETRGMIPDFKLPLSDLTVSVLANALYFKGAWAEKFEKEKTTDGAFHGAAKDTRAHMMRGVKKVAYYVDDNLSMATLDFGNAAFDMHFVLPAESTTPIDLFRNGNLTSEILFAGDEKEVYLSIPRFSIPGGEKIDISETLSELGLTALDAKGEFKMFTETLQDVVTTVYQKAAVEVNEEGAEAAAVTVITNDILANLPPEFTLDRPFLFVITEKSTQTILFAGRVAQL